MEKPHIFVAILNKRKKVINILCYFTNPTLQHSVAMALMLKELVVYHELECLSIIELLQML